MNRSLEDAMLLAAKMGYKVIVTVEPESLMFTVNIDRRNWAGSKGEICKQLNLFVNLLWRPSDERAEEVQSE